MDGLLLDHFQQLMVILHHEMPAIDVGVELLQTEAYLTDTLTQCLHSKSQHQ